MYYIKYIMNNYFIKIISYCYYFSLVILLILYLYPGSLLGYFMYENLNRQPNIIKNPIGTSINHFFYFFYLSIIALVCNINRTHFFSNLYFILILSILLEISHLIIPKRGFELYDLLANVLGVLVVIILHEIFKWLRKQL